MNTFKSLIAVAVLMSSTVFAANPKYSRGDLIHTNQPFVRVGGDRVIFGFKVTERCDVESLKAAAIALKTRSSTDRFDDQWYAFSVPQGRCLMMGYYNLDSKKYGWAAILNKPNTWSVRNSKQNWKDIGNGVQQKYSYSVNGQNVDLDIFNPKNEGALTGNDILISFGY